MRCIIAIYAGAIGIAVGSQYLLVRLDHPEAVWFWCRVLNLC